MKNVVIIALALLSLALTACAPQPKATTAESAAAVAEKIVYVKDDRTGLCFGVLSTVGMNIIDDTRNMNVILVPCDAVKDHLARRK